MSEWVSEWVSERKKERRKGKERKKSRCAQSQRKSKKESMTEWQVDWTHESKQALIHSVRFIFMIPELSGSFFSNRLKAKQRCKIEWTKSPNRRVPSLRIYRSIKNDNISMFSWNPVDGVCVLVKQKKNDNDESILFVVISLPMSYNASFNLSALSMPEVPLVCVLNMFCQKRSEHMTFL